jgi:hypothetical protein
VAAPKERPAVRPVVRRGVCREPLDGGEHRRRAAALARRARLRAREHGVIQRPALHKEVPDLSVILVGDGLKRIEVEDNAVRRVGATRP